MAHPAEELQTVGLERHPSPPAVAEPSTRQGTLHPGTVDPHPGRQTLDDSSQGGAVGLPGGQPTQHGPHPLRPGW